MRSSLRMLLALCILLPSAASALIQDTCQEEIARENAEDTRIHECRSCQPLEVDASANCPLKGYFCENTLPMRTNVLSSGGRDCLQLRCADSNATLAVERKLVTKVTCAGKEWHSSKEEIAASGVCARKCGVGVCRTLPSNVFTLNPEILPFVPNAPDASHPCAWGSCPDGAIGGDANPEHPYPGTVVFSCTGDGKWSMPDEKRVTYVACKAAPKCTVLRAATVDECAPLTPGGPPQCSPTTFPTITTETMRCPGQTSIRILTDIGEGRYSNTGTRLSIVCRADGWYGERAPGNFEKIDLANYNSPIVGCTP